jgi:hypothetical protein
MQASSMKLPTSFAILFVAINALAVAQNARRGGFGQSPASQAAAKAQTELATSQMHAYLNEIGYRMLAERAKRIAAVTTRDQAISRRIALRSTPGCTRIFPKA